VGEGEGVGVGAIVGVGDGVGVGVGVIVGADVGVGVFIGVGVGVGRNVVRSIFWFSGKFSLNEFEVLEVTNSQRILVFVEFEYVVYCENSFGELREFSSVTEMLQFWAWSLCPDNN
jgi:hypothetical protein